MHTVTESAPLFIVGTGRCGSTIFNDILAHHPEVCWLSTVGNQFPQRPHVNALSMRAIDLPAISPLAPRRIYPVEAYEFWEARMPGFSPPCRDLVAEDVTPVIKKQI